MFYFWPNTLSIAEPNKKITQCRLVFQAVPLDGLKIDENFLDAKNALLGVRYL